MGPFSESASMLKLQIQRWSERPRILVLMLAMVLPAVALIVFGLYHLRHIQRDKAIEAAFKIDYQQVLAIAEKRINERAYEIADEAREKFPDTDHPEEIDSFLTTHPEITHAFLWTGKGDITFRSQLSRMRDPKFCAEDRMLMSDFGTWWDMDGKETIAKLKKIELKEGRHLFFMPHWIMRGEKKEFLSLALFRPNVSSVEHPALAGFIYDT